MLARSVNLEELVKRLSEVHERTYCAENKIPLYRRLQRLGYFWLDMKTQEGKVQSHCPTCQHVFNRLESYAIFHTIDWRTPFLEFILEGVLPTDRKEAHYLKKLARCYFVEGGILFHKGYNGEPLKCLGLAESQAVMREVHGGKR